MKIPIDLIIDIVGTCNLRCPSCAVGNMPQHINSKHIMEPSTLEKIIAKATSECKVSTVYLFNWGEPFLHPQLPKMVEIAKTLNVPCHLSSNFNVINNLEEVILKKPDSLRISLSGFNQETYGRTHRGGNIEVVKKNLNELASILRRTRSATKAHIFFHRYKHNLTDEIRLKEFAGKLGFGFHPVWALMMPAEKVAAFADPDNSPVRLTDQDRNLIQSLALPLDKALAACRRYKTQPCNLSSKQMVLDSLGRVKSCCILYDSAQFTIAPYLETSFTKIQHIKKNHPFCAVCRKHGIHFYQTHGAFECEAIAARNIDATFAYSLSLRWERFKKRIFLKIIPSSLRRQAYDLYARLTSF